jgi:gluconokinase
MIIVVMGVSGAGKTTLGRRLAERLGMPFIEGDDFHPAANVAKMASGLPLDDADRWPWLDRLNEEIKKHRHAVLACSALKEAYRERLLRGVGEALIVHLRGEKALISERLKARKHRYMPASLLDSQFATLEPPRQAIVVDVGGDPAQCLERILAAISRRAPAA